MAVNAWSPNIQDKVFIVTGGAAGIGAAVAKNLLSENARAVVFLDVCEKEGLYLESELSSYSGPLTAKFIKCDVSNEQELEEAFQHVFDKYQKLDVLINNAGICGTDEIFRKLIDVNFTATVNSTLKGIDMMSAEKGGSGGTIVNTSSLIALSHHHSHLPVYSATKAAVLQFTNALGREDFYSKTKVRVMSVCLGPTDTALLNRRDLENFNKDCSSLSSRVPERQRVESAAAGIIDVIKHGKNGSTWVVADNKAPKDITKSINEGFSKIDASGD